MASSSSSFCNWVYDVFVSFRGEDVRKNFLSHLLKELDRKLIKTFIDNEIVKGQSIDPVLKQAIETSKIAVVVFSENYASSSWCLDELVEIVKCKQKSDQVVIPIFYGLDPSDVRKPFGKFGKVFENTCRNKSKNQINLWRNSLIEVANVCGIHSQNWANEAKMVEEIVKDVLDKILDLIPRKEFGDFFGMEDHIANINELLHLESEEVRMVGIWGSSGIGKTSIAIALYSQLSHRFQCKIFIDKEFVSDVMKKYENPNPYDPNMKLHLVRKFLSEILDKKNIKIDSFDSMRQMLKNHKILIFIDDLDHQEVLDTLVGQSQWFGCGSRIIVITQDKHFLRAHGIDQIYEVCLPSDELALKIFCKSAFGIYPPPDGLMEFASKIALSAGNLPLGLRILGSYVRGRKKETLIEMLPDLLKCLNGDIKNTLRVSYDGLNNENHKTIFRHIACVFNGERESDIKLLLADSNLDVVIGLENLVDKSLIHVRNGNIEMQSLLQKMGKEIVRAQSNEPGKREFLVDAKDICDLLKNNTSTSEVLGIALDMNEMDKLHIRDLLIHKSAFKNMPKLLFLKVYTDPCRKRLTTKWNEKKGVRWHLPQKLRLLRLDGYPRRCLPLSFCPQNLVKLIMPWSKLEKLWEGVQTLGGLKEIDLGGSIYLKEIPDLSMATNLEKLSLWECSSLVELPSSIQYLNKLLTLSMWGCSSLETLPNGINLKSLSILLFNECPRLSSFPDISTNISTLFLSHGNLGMNRIISETLWARPCSLKVLSLTNIPSLVELPSSIQNFSELEYLSVSDCINLETIPTDIDFCFLRDLRFEGCSRLRTFPNISTNIKYLYLDKTGIEEVPWWIENFTKLKKIYMNNCNDLVRVSLHIFKLKLLKEAEFWNSGALAEASWNGIPIAVEEVLLNEEVPSYFIHQTTGYSLTDIPLLHTSLSQHSLKFRACVVVVLDSDPYDFYIHVDCWFKDRLGNKFLWVSENHFFLRYWGSSVLFVLDSLIPLDTEIAPLAQLNYDHVDMEIHICDRWSTDTTFELQRWGIQLLEDNEDSEYSDEDIEDSEYCDEEIEDSEECTQTVGKRQRETGSLDFEEIQPFEKRQDR